MVFTPSESRSVRADVIPGSERSATGVPRRPGESSAIHPVRPSCGACEISRPRQPRPPACPAPPRPPTTRCCSSPRRMVFTPSEPRSVRADVIPGSERSATGVTRRPGVVAPSTPFGRAVEHARSAARASPGPCLPLPLPLRALRPPQPLPVYLRSRAARCRTLRGSPRGLWFLSPPIRGLRLARSLRRYRVATPTLAPNPGYHLPARSAAPFFLPPPPPRRMCCRPPIPRRSPCPRRMVLSHPPVPPAVSPVLAGWCWRPRSRGACGQMLSPVRSGAPPATR